MNKNIVIGLLVVVIVIAGGYYLLTMNSSSTVYQPNTTSQNPTSTTPANTTTSTQNTTPSAPGTPLTLSTPVVETGPNSITSSGGALVTGQITPGGLSTSYWFEYGNTNSLGSRTVTQQIGSGYYPFPSPAYITGLSANTTYYYRLMANNNMGAVSGATYNFKTNSNPPLRAAVPTARTSNATNALRSSVTLNGQVNPNGFQTNYWFEYGKDNKLGNTSSVTSVNENVPLTSLVNVSEPLTGLEPLTKYFFRINAQNQFGTVNGSILNFTTKGPLNPATTN